MEYKKALKRLAGVRRVLVTGPQRSGTTICAKMLSADLGLTYHDENEFGVFNLGKLHEIVKHDEFVIQGPAVSFVCHELPVHVVFMRRSVEDIVASQERIGWGWANEAGERNTQVTKFGFQDADKYPVAEIKYRIWESIQRPLLGDRALEIEYESLRGHPFWVEKPDRKDWGPRQTEV